MKKLLLFFLVFFFSIVSFEIFLRYSPFSYGITPMEYDKEIGMWHKKSFSNNIVKKCYNVKYSFDSYGRISNSYQYNNKKEDIVLLGDSQIEALMVKNEKVIHNVMNKLLNYKYNVLNYGLSGTGPSQQLMILKKKVTMNKINSLIQFVFIENDLNDSDPENIDGTNRPKVYTVFENLNDYKVIPPKSYDIKEKIRDFLGKFELYVYLKKTFYHYKNLFKKSEIIYDQKKDFHIKNSDYKWKQLFGSIFQINKLSKKNGFKYHVVVFSSNEFNYNFKNHRLKLERFLNKNKIDSINIVPFLKKLENINSISFDCDGHWNENTHYEISKFLKGKLYD